MELDPLAYRRRTISPAFFGLRAKTMKQTRSRAKSPSCSRPLLPATDGKSSSQSNGAMERRHCAKLNLEPDEGYRRFLARARALCARRPQGRGRSFEPNSSKRARDQLAYQIAKFMQCAVKPTKLSSGYRSPSIITTPARLAILVDPLLHGLRDDPRYKAFVAKMNFPATS